MGTKSEKATPKIGPPNVAMQIVGLRIARDRLREARREVNVRADRSRAWMDQDRHRTLGEASAYVGLDSAMDDVKEARRFLTAAVDRLLNEAGNVELEAAHIARNKGGAS